LLAAGRESYTGRYVNQQAVHPAYRLPEAAEFANQLRRALLRALFRNGRPAFLVHDALVEDLRILLVRDVAASGSSPPSGS